MIFLFTMNPEKFSGVSSARDAQFHGSFSQKFLHDVSRPTQENEHSEMQQQPSICISPLANEQVRDRHVQTAVLPSSGYRNDPVLVEFTSDRFEEWTSNGVLNTPVVFRLSLMLSIDLQT